MGDRSKLNAHFRSEANIEEFRLCVRLLDVTEYFESIILKVKNLALNMVAAVSFGSIGLAIDKTAHSYSESITYAAFALAMFFTLFRVVAPIMTTITMLPTDQKTKQSVGYKFLKKYMFIEEWMHDLDYQRTVKVMSSLGQQQPLVLTRFKLHRQI